MRDIAAMAATAAPRAKNPTYREYDPGPLLRPFVSCLWTIRADDAPRTVNRVVPDGCADIIAGIGAEEEPVVVGTMRRARVVPVQGRVSVTGIRFRPGCALPFVGAPLHELTDATVPLASLWSREVATVAAALAVERPDERVRRLERVLLPAARRVRRGARGDEALVAAAVALVRRARGGVTVAQTAEALGVGERRLQRAFDRSVGIGPKAYGRVARFRHVLRLLEAHGSRRGWSALAADAGYADQSHLIREFRDLAGVTPAGYVAERAGVGFVQYGDGAAP